MSEVSQHPLFKELFEAQSFMQQQERLGLIVPSNLSTLYGRVLVYLNTLTPVADYIEILEDRKRLVRELDVALNGEAGAAKQASLCDLVAQVQEMRRKGLIVDDRPMGD